MKIQEIMTKPAVTCCSGDTLSTAANLMWDQDCGALPVVDEDGRTVGMITDRDICMSALTQGAPIEQIKVSTAMAERVFSCRLGDPLEVAERLMTEHQVRRVPVVDEQQRPVGVISINDLVRHAAAARSNGKGRDGVTSVLAAVGRGRGHFAEPGQIGSAIQAAVSSQGAAPRS